jgi:dipeptidyl aminopeptidase/acylaminoacyl peptidase
MISLTLQFAGLFYANKYLLASSTDIKTKKVVKSDNKKPDIEISIPDSAKNINISFDGKFLAYYDADVLKVVNTTTGEEKKVEFGDGVQVSFYKWLSDRNRMLIAEKETSNQESNFKLAYYDVSKDLKEDIKDLDLTDKKSEVEDIQASPLTNVIYVKVANSGKRSNIYRIDIMKEMKTVETRSYQIGKIRVIPHEDKLIYEDLTHGRIYITDKDEPLDISGVNKPSLLGVDDNDNVYIGETDLDKVTKIFYGTVKEGKNELQTIDLGSAVDKNNILIANEGKVYINDNLKGLVKEFASGKEYKYLGTFIQMYNGGVISVSEGKLIKTLFN